MNESKIIQQELAKKASAEKAKSSARFFKTGPGEYGEGDQFIGVSVPDQRVIAKKYVHASLEDVMKLLSSPIHEHRVTAALILTYQFQKADLAGQKAIYDAYLKNRQWINNWDIVDTSAHKIVGAYLHTRSRQPIYTLAKSKNLWEKRIAIIATAWFIKHGDFTDTLKLAKQFLKEEHDLMHKAVGWMLREVGKQDKKALITFLDAHAHEMPRTMLRYAIERLSKAKRTHYMKK